MWEHREQFIVTNGNGRKVAVLTLNKTGNVIFLSGIEEGIGASMTEDDMKCLCDAIKEAKENMGWSK